MRNSFPLAPNGRAISSEGRLGLPAFVRGFFHVFRSFCLCCGRRAARLRGHEVSDVAGAISDPRSDANELGPAALQTPLVEGGLGTAQQRRDFWHGQECPSVGRGSAYVTTSIALGS